MARLSLTSEFKLCARTHERFETKECSYYLEECNLCNSISYCKQHGCRECGLEKDQNVPSLTVLPDDERQILIEVNKARKNLTPQKRIKAKKNATHPTEYYRELYLQDILDANKINDYQA